MNPKKFERIMFDEYLQNHFVKNYMGSKDDCEDAFDSWLSQLDVQEVIDFADAWGDEVYSVGFGRGLVEIQKKQNANT